jgi:integrase/recombinase XerD
MDWANKLKAPPEPTYKPKRITIEDLHNTLDYFREHQYYPQIKAIIYLGATTGLRAEELFQLTKDNINIKSRTIEVNHNPDNGQTTKTGNSRIVIFNNEAKQAMVDYYNYFDNNERLLSLFGLKHIERQFRNAPIKVKDLRKFFSQEWDRKGGPTSIKKLLMGHSADVDLLHYNAQNEEDLRNIYNRVGITIGF